MLSVHLIEKFVYLDWERIAERVCMLKSGGFCEVTKKSLNRRSELGYADKVCDTRGELRDHIPLNGLVV